MTRPTFEQLAEWTIAALANARRLFDDATLLLGVGRSTSAMVLLGLSADELGKHMMIMAMPSRADSDAEWKKFARRMGSHTEKLGNPLLWDWMADLLLLDGPPDPNTFHQLRLAATYTDLANGELRIPDHVVSAAAVADELEKIGRILDRAESMFGGADPALLARTMHRARESSQATLKESRLEAIAYSIARTNGVSHSDAQRLASVVNDVLGPL